MQIAISMPYDEQLLRRTVKFLAQAQLRRIRPLGGVCLALGLLLVFLDPANLVAYTAIAVGLAFMFLVLPLTVANAMRAQPEAIRHGNAITLDDEWLQVNYPLVESRFRWAALGRVVETPEVWYLMFGKAQAVTVPKHAMAPEQVAEFTTFLAQLRPVVTR